MDAASVEETTVDLFEGEAPGRNYFEMIFVMHGEQHEHLTYASYN